MSRIFQYPFDFSFHDELVFNSFLTTPETAPVLDYLRNFPGGNDQFCYLWGTPGSGKTHLLQALCHASAAAVYLPLQLLLQYGPQSLDGLEAGNFLVLDDLQVVAGKADWEEKLFYVFNAIHAQGGKLCLAADSNPAGLPLVLPDLRSRLQLAVIYAVTELDDEGKLHVLMQRAHGRGMELKAEVASYILLHSKRSMHELIQVLDRLDTLSLAEKRRLTIPFIREIAGW